VRRQLEALYARVPLGMRLGLDAMRAACSQFGHPERAFRSVHIAGTNGKGSTCAMVESIARASGLKTGMYTSPHLVRFAERIRINGEPIVGVETYLDEALRADLSFFETATLAAFLAFRAEKVDLAVIEVGIGGRLDATNVLPNDTVKCSAVTNIAFDHMDKLGDTLPKIAAEKAAIARPNVPLVHGALPADVMIELGKAASAVKAPVVFAPEYDGAIGLEGPHQRANAGIAAAIARELALSSAIETGIAAAKWPGRMERIGDWLLDGAHNPDGARALVRALASERVGAVIFGALVDKSWEQMLAEVTHVEAPRFYVRPTGRVAVDPALLAGKAMGIPCDSLADAMNARHTAGTKVVCGSLYLVGEARAALLNLERDPIVAL
jgi:dihydrofolate synthase/folylpolyglutamate synthase